MLTRPFVAVLVLLAGSAVAADGQDFQVVKVASVAGSAVDQLKPKTIIYNDRQGGETSDEGAFIPFDEWARSRPLQRKFLSLYPEYTEGTVHRVVDGGKREVKDELQMYISEARFRLSRPATSISLERFITLPFIQSIDPAIKHKVITASEISIDKDERTAHNKNPHRAWCVGERLICAHSSYKLEGKIPLGIALANKLRDSERKISDTIEFESELRLLTPAEVDDAGLQQLTGVATPVSGVLEQNMFYVNQVMRFGKLLAVLQPSPDNAQSTVATVMIALAVSSNTLETKKKYQNVPVLRNLVPVQVLLGKSSFNTGNSISSGLPNYVRNRIKAIAGILDRG